MKAIVQDEYGQPDKLRLEEIDKPEAGDDDVLVRIHAASVHIGDWHVMTGLPYMLRVVGFGLRKPKVPVRGLDVAGTVEAVGKNVTQLSVGDEVFGTCEGSFAEYARAPEEKVVRKPGNLTFEQAAAVPTSGFAALQALRDRGEVKPDQKVLIIGASGGTGIYAVQIAKALGTEVTGVCSSSKIDLVRSLGADYVIDYTKEDFSQGDQRYDVILDLGGNRSLADLRRRLTPEGALVLVGGEGGGRFLGGTDRSIQAMLLSPFVRHKLRPLSTKERKEDLEFLKELIETGKVAPVIDRTFALGEVPDAFRYLKDRVSLGKVVINV